MSRCVGHRDKVLIRALPVKAKPKSKSKPKSKPTKNCEDCLAKVRTPPVVITLVAARSSSCVAGSHYV